MDDADFNEICIVCGGNEPCSHDFDKMRQGWEDFFKFLEDANQECLEKFDMTLSDMLNDSSKNSNGDLCNGSTSLSERAGEGSIPSSPTKVYEPN